MFLKHPSSKTEVIPTCGGTIRCTVARRGTVDAATLDRAGPLAVAVAVAAAVPVAGARRAPVAVKVTKGRPSAGKEFTQ